MANIMTDRFNRPGEQANLGFALAQAATLGVSGTATDKVFVRLVDVPSGRVLEVSLPNLPPRKSA